MNTKEIWKDIPNYVGVYQVSNLGRVKSLIRKWRTKERILKPSLNGKRYLQVILSKENKFKTYKIHKLVVISFFNNKSNRYKLVIDHINNNQLDNRVENLQLITNRANCSKDQKNRSSKYIGVCFFKRDKKWRARIRINGKSKHLGLFMNEYDAHLEYQKELKKYNNENNIR